MKSKTVVFFVGMAALFSAAFSHAQSVNLSGRWVLNNGKSSYGEVSPVLPQIVLEIEHEGIRLNTVWTFNVPNRDIVKAYHFTTDGKECVNSGESVKDLKSICAWKDDRLIIAGDKEGMRAEGNPDGEPTIVEYFKFACTEEYSLSADKTALTVVQTLKFDSDVKTATYVFDKS